MSTTRDTLLATILATTLWILLPPSLRAADRLFPPDAVVNVTLPPYEAQPDDRVDDTKAIQRAISDCVETGRFLYFPAGVYEVSAPLAARNAQGAWRAQLTLQGQGRERTILKLADNTPEFADPSKALAILSTGSHWNEGDGLEGGGNKAFRNNIMDLTIDTGKGNPGAIAVEWAVSNHGTIRNVSIHSSDGAGIAGISMKRRIPGPGFIKHVSIDGFDAGLDIDDIQYGITVENLILRNQRVAGIRMGQNLIHARRITSINRVPALLVTRIEGVATLLDSSFTGGSPDQPAIRSDGPLLLRNVVTEGYAPDALEWRGEKITASTFAEWIGPPMPNSPGSPGSPHGATSNSPGLRSYPGDPTATAASPARAASKSTSSSASIEPISDETMEKEGALLPVEETPDFWNADLRDWQPVGPRREGEDHDGPAVQRAIDSGKGTVYFPFGRTYFLSDTVIVRGAVRQVFGMGSEISLGAAKEPFSDRKNPRPLFRIDPTKHATVFFDHLFFNAQYPGEVLFENNTAADVVIRHCGGWVGAEGSRRSYRNTPDATGRLFLEDVYLPGWEFDHQRVWARQFNPENYDSDGSASQVLNRGGKLWILGFKTEGAAPFISTTQGATTELLGAYNYISATQPDPVPAKAVPYIVEDSRAALTFTAENFRNTDYRVYIREKKGESVRELSGSDLPPRNGRPGDRSFAVPLYRTKARSK